MKAIIVEGSFLLLMPMSEEFKANKDGKGRKAN